MRANGNRGKTTQGAKPHGLTVIFSHNQVCIKKKKGGHFWGGPKVKVVFRHLFSLQKRFSLCSSHKINANIDVFC